MAEPFPVYKTRADLERLLADGLVESLQVEFKASEALTREGGKPNELCISVSAMANSAGGQIFCCIDEAKKTNGPIRVDDGVTDPKLTREWIEQIFAISGPSPHDRCPD
jgi:predicted HTH transcriptional regulator